MSVRDRASPGCCVACALSPVSDFRLDSQARTFEGVNFKIVFTAFLSRCNFKAVSGSTLLGMRAGQVMLRLCWESKKKVAEEDEESEFDLTVSEIQLKKGKQWNCPRYSPCYPHLWTPEILLGSWESVAFVTYGHLAVMRVCKVGEVFVLTLSLSGCLIWFMAVVWSGKYVCTHNKGKLFLKVCVVFVKCQLRYTEKS